MSIQPVEVRGSPRSPGTASPTPQRDRRTRTSRAWAMTTGGLIALVIVLVFALQNLQRVEVTFLSLHGHLPLAVLLLLVAVLGALVVFAFGASRIVQLRVQARRRFRGSEKQVVLDKLNDAAETLHASQKEK